MGGTSKSGAGLPDEAALRLMEEAARHMPGEDAVKAASNAGKALKGVNYHYISLAGEAAGMEPEEAASVIGSRIRAGRKEAGLTAKELGERLDPPVSSSAVTAWERGIKPLAPERRDQIEEVLADALKRVEDRASGGEFCFIRLGDNPARARSESALVDAAESLSMKGIAQLLEYAEFLQGKYPRERG